MPTVGVFAAIFDGDGHMLFVKQNYGARHWTIPGGGVERGESPVQALKREVQEETGFIANVHELVGLYSTPWKDDLVLCFKAEIVDRGAWQPDREIAARGFFGRNELPEPMNPRMRRRVLDAFDGKTGIVRVFDADCLVLEHP